MKLWTLIAFVVLPALALAQVFMLPPPQPEGLATLVITNSPDKWILSWSTDGTNWTEYLRKTSLSPLKTLEISVPAVDARQYWKLERLQP